MPKDEGIGSFSRLARRTTGICFYSSVHIKRHPYRVA